MPQPTSRSRFTGKSLAIALFGVVVAGVTAVWSVQIIQQGFWPQAPAANLDCRPGIVSLIHAVERARQSAAAQEGEQSAVDAFRREIHSSWRDFPQLARACKGDSDAKKLLVKLERLRFAEEHAVRYEARDVAFWRRELSLVKDEWSGVPLPK